jgi:hypothetical protein
VLGLAGARDGRCQREEVLDMADGDKGIANRAHYLCTPEAR